MVTVAQVTAACTGHKDPRSHGPCTEIRNVEGWEDTEVGLGRGRVGYTNHMRKMRIKCHGKNHSTQKRRGFHPKDNPKWMELQARVKR